MKPSLLLSLMMLASIPCARAAEKILLNDTFDAAYLSGGDSADLEVQSAQDLPHSAEWFLSYQAEPVSLKANLVFSAAGEQRGMTLRDVAESGVFNVMAYFTDSRAETIHLNVGDSLTVTFDVAVKNPQSKRSGFLVGLMNAHGSQLVSPYYVYDDGATSRPFGGYIVDANPGTEDSQHATAIYRRQPSETLHSLYHSETLSNESFVGASTGAALDLPEGGICEGSLRITRVSETENEIAFSLNGVEITTLDTGADLFSFDSVNFGYGGLEAATSITLNNIRVVLRTSGDS